MTVTTVITIVVTLVAVNYDSTTMYHAIFHVVTRLLTGTTG